MSNVTVYLKCDRNVEVQSEDVFLSDLGEVRCSDNVTAAKLKALKAHHFGKQDTKRCVISTLKLVELMEDTCPNITVQIVGEPDVLVEWISVDRHKGWQQWLKAALVCLVIAAAGVLVCLGFRRDRHLWALEE